MTKQTSEGLVVGFDLDMTLVDSRPGIAASLKAMGIGGDEAEAIANRSGPPIENELALFFPDQTEVWKLETFRMHMGRVGVRMCERLPGADGAFEVVRELGGRIIVLTAKQTRLAIATLANVGLEADDVQGELWEGKTDSLVAAGAWGYVGDHTNDMVVAKDAGVQAIGVASGACSAEELWAAGADRVLTTLEEFPDILRASVR